MNSRCPMQDQEIVLQNDEVEKVLVIHIKRGDHCPICGQGRMDYDGLLNLSCEQCGYTQSDGGGFT